MESNSYLMMTSIPLDPKTMVYVYENVTNSEIWEWTGKCNLELAIKHHNWLKQESSKKETKNKRYSGQALLFPAHELLGKYIEIRNGYIIGWSDNWKELQRLKALGRN